MSDGSDVRIAVDPVCGMKVEEGMSPSTNRDGRTFHFCGERCRERFLSDGFVAKFEETSGGFRG
jgi:YHS domain-containing protein